MPPGERVLPAAVIGVSFPADLLAQVAGVDRADALDGLAAHAHTGLVVFDAVRSPLGCCCASAGVRQHRSSERARLHGRVAEELVAWKDRDRLVDPAEVALHLLASGSNDRRAAESPLGR